MKQQLKKQAEIKSLENPNIERQIYLKKYFLYVKHTWELISLLKKTLKCQMWSFLFKFRSRSQHFSVCYLHFYYTADICLPIRFRCASVNTRSCAYLTSVCVDIAEWLQKRSGEYDTLCHDSQFLVLQQVGYSINNGCRRQGLGREAEWWIHASKCPFYQNSAGN